MGSRDGKEENGGVEAHLNLDAFEFLYRRIKTNRPSQPIPTCPDSMGTYATTVTDSAMDNMSENFWVRKSLEGYGRTRLYPYVQRRIESEGKRPPDCREYKP